jgi:hypothetical protein
VQSALGPVPAQTRGVSDTVITAAEHLDEAKLEAVEALLRFVEQANAEGTTPDTETWLKLLGEAFASRPA